MPVESWKRSIEAIVNQFNNLRESIYIFSTSASYDEAHPKNNLYMWGHYANGHRGIAIEFNTMEIAKPLIEDHIRQHGESLRPEEVWVKMDYMKKVPPITREMFFDFARGEYDRVERKTSLHEYYDKLSTIKSTVWESENEWRLMWQRDDTRRKVLKASIVEKAIERIYIGLNASSKFREERLSLSFRRDQHFVCDGFCGEADCEERTEGGVTGFAAIEAEDELVEIGLKMLFA